MKLLITLIASGLMTSAFASVHIGDMGKYSFSTVVNNVAATGELIYEITEYNTTDDKYKTELETVESTGARNTEEDWVDATDIYTHEQAKQALAYCSLIGGVAEEITVSGSKYDTCKLPLDTTMLRGVFKKFGITSKTTAVKGSIWLGDFPVIGVGRIKSTEGTIELLDFNWTK
jgi:hypothetical protein